MHCAVMPHTALHCTAYCELMPDTSLKLELNAMSHADADVDADVDADADADAGHQGTSRCAS
jgi:hypothetical protein